MIDEYNRRVLAGKDPWEGMGPATKFREKFATGVVLAVTLRRENGTRFVACPHCGGEHAYPDDAIGAVKMAPCSDKQIQIATTMGLG